jgi:hypothetical protein
MRALGIGLHEADHHEDALSVKETELSTLRRLGAQEEDLFTAQTNLALTYSKLGRDEEALQIERDVYSGRLKLLGEEHSQTILAANNYANSLLGLKRHAEAKSVARKMIPVARRALGDDDRLTLKLRRNYAQSLCGDPNSTLDDLREAATAVEDVGRIARRVLGGAHPFTTEIEPLVRAARAVLATSATPPPSA